MAIGERIILRLSRSPEAADYVPSKKEYTLTNALNLLKTEFPDLEKLVSGGRVVDFGCGHGYQAMALAATCNCTTVGIDSNRRTLQEAREITDSELPHNSRVTFDDRIRDDMMGTFDVVISQNSFEHFQDPVGVTEQMKSLLKKGGKLLITFGPPWFAPYGSHMHFFCKIPWLNILCPEKTVMRARKHFRQDGAMRYEDVESGLNKMSLAKFERIIYASGMNVDYLKFRCIKGLDFLSRAPGLRELTVNRVTAMLSRTA